MKLRTTIATLMLASIALTSSHIHAETTDTINTFAGTYEAEIAASISDKNGYTPFWLISNRSGLGSVEPNFGFVRGAVHTYGTISPRWTWNAGIDLVGSWRSDRPFLIRELYGAIRYRDFQLTVGSKIENDRLVDQNLSSGDMLYSGNSLPIPQARLEMPDYMDIPWVNNWVGFKAYFGFGMFTDSNWQRDFTSPKSRHYKNILYHSKGLRIRVGREDKFPLTFEGGLEMGAQFGGKIMVGDSMIQNMPNGIKDIFHVIIPSGGGGSDLPGEESNCYGNHVGEWSARLNWHPSQEWGVSAYYLHYFEDHSMMFFDYVWHDGMYGLEFKLPSKWFINKFVYEYIYTKDQAGAVYWDITDDIPEQVSGCDNYYNHYLFGGWQSWGMGIGNPLIISPIWNADHSLQFKCNRIVAHHFGISGNAGAQIDWRALASYTRGWGTYGSPYKEVERNINLMGEVTYKPAKLAGWSATLGIGIDRGNMIGHSVGGMLTIRKTGIL